MGPLVCFKSASLSKPFPTLKADKGFLASVDLSVLFEATESSEMLSALRAVVRPLSRVHALVYFQIAQLSKPPPTL